MRLEILDPKSFGLIQHREMNNLEIKGALFDIYSATNECREYVGLEKIDIESIYDGSIYNGTKLCFEEPIKLLVEDGGDYYVYASYFFLVKNNTQDVFCYAFENREDEDNPTMFGRLVP